jgi:hypothetical protein
MYGANLMNNRLQEFIIDLLDQPKTRVSIEKDGFSVLNADLKLKMRIFSDKLNGFYFEAQPYISFFDTKEIFPTYRTEDKEEAQLICDEVLNRLDMDRTQYDSESSKCVKLFRSVLQGNPVPEEYEMSRTTEVIQLKNKNSGIRFRIFFDETELDLDRVNKIHEPTTLLKVGIYGSPDRIDFYIPKYAIQRYPLLQKNFCLKNEEQLEKSIDDWLTKLSSLESVQASQFSKLVDYHRLSENLENTSNNKPKVPKI